MAIIPAQLISVQLLSQKIQFNRPLPRAPLKLNLAPRRPNPTLVYAKGAQKQKHYLYDLK